MLFRSPSITIDAALRDLQGGGDRARAAAASALGDAGEGDRERAAEALLGVLGDLRAEVRAAACMSLGELGRADAAEALALRLSDGDPEVRQVAAIALGKLGAAAGFGPLADALADGPPDLRFQAATSLVEIDPARAFSPLVAALERESDGEVLGAIAIALGAIGDARAGDAIARLLDHARPGTRFDAAYALAELGDERGATELAAAIGDQASGWDAASALEMLGAPGAVHLAAALARSLPPRTELRAAAALLRVAPQHQAAPRAREALLRGLAHRKLEIRGLAVAELATAGGPWAHEALTALRSRRAGRALADDIDATLAAIAETAP